MPFGSAASLPGTLPQAPLSPHPATRRSPRFVVPHNWGDVAPPRIVPLQKAAEDPPRGYVLLADGHATSALEAQGLLREAGYRVLGPATCAAEALRLIERARVPLSCGLLDLELGDAPSIADRLAARDIPVVWLVSTANIPLPSDHAAAPTLHRPFSRDALVEALEMASHQGARQRYYVTPPPQAAWPRVFPQL
jgi:CheY-like chemotaxis protein